MTAPTMEELVALEQQYGLSEDDLSYQQRCSRIAAYQNGEGKSWKPNTKAKPKKKKKIPMEQAAQQHPLYGKTLLISPLMAPNKNQNLAYEEYIGHDIQAREAHAGEMIQSDPEAERMYGDYVIVSEDTRKKIFAKTTLPKIGTEISWTLGKELVPVVRGNDGQRGYLWYIQPYQIQVNDTIIPVYGLKTLITQTFPDLLTEFSGKPMMSYIDGVTLAANIPMTEALLQRRTRQEKLDAKAGIL